MDIRVGEWLYTGSLLPGKRPNYLLLLVSHDNEVFPVIGMYKHKESKFIFHNPFKSDSTEKYIIKAWQYIEHVDLIEIKHGEESECYLE